MSEHVRDRYLDWRDADGDRRAAVDRHLLECEGCRRYFREMDRLLDPALLAGAEPLSPDPYLPERVAALSAMRRRAEAGARPTGVLLAFQGAAFAAAVVIGIFVGTSVVGEPPSADVEEIVSLCRDAVQQDDDALRFEAVLDESEGGIE